MLVGNWVKLWILYLQVRAMKHSEWNRERFQTKPLPPARLMCRTLVPETEGNDRILLNFYYFTTYKRIEFVSQIIWFFAIKICSPFRLTWKSFFFLSFFCSLLFMVKTYLIWNIQFVNRHTCFNENFIFFHITIIINKFKKINNLFSVCDDVVK